MDYLSDDGSFKVDPHFGAFSWTKEPSFTSEQADELNLITDEFERERIFFESHLKHQKSVTVASKNLIFDCYIWTALAYCKYYSVGCFGFAKALYLSQELFHPADLYIFVDTPPEVCFDREPELDLKVLRSLQKTYYDTRQYIKTPIIEIQAIGGEDRTLTELVEKFDKFIKGTDHLVD